ncbi:MAG: glycosyltransferase family 4 protein [Pirellulales bacterium]|nr:glycosyltransferase family 4 protein [Pirellulales bacterium]
MIRSTDSDSALVTFVGPLPPPVTGMTAMTEVVVESLGRDAPLRSLGWSSASLPGSLGWKLARAKGYFLAMARLLLGKRVVGGRLYCLANSGWGLYYDIALTFIARLRGYRVVLHHHVYSYITRYSRRMALVNRIVGTDGIHVVHCQQMKADFLAMYPTGAEFLFLPPTIVVQKEPTQGFSPNKGFQSAADSPRRFRLGFLSNLSVEKGLHLVLTTFEQLRAAGDDVQLTLAGHCLSSKEQDLIDQAVERWPTDIEYAGPVYGEKKIQFFDSIDLFLFPTQYQNESWGIVLTEALAAARPVVAYGRGCIPWIVRDGCGSAIDPKEDYVSQAVALIRGWIRDPASYRQTCERAAARSEALNVEAIEQFAAFVARMGQR